MSDDTAPDLALTRDVLRDGFGRVALGVPAVVEGLSPAQLLWRPDADANPIAWLVWHLARQQDGQVSHLVDRRSLWTGEDWVGRFALPYDRSASGYGMSSDDVGRFTLDDPQLLVDYYAAVHQMTTAVLDELTAEQLREVIDTSWDPPVTAMARLVSILEDATKHLGQAEYVRGLAERR